MLYIDEIVNIFCRTLALCATVVCSSCEGATEERTSQASVFLSVSMNVAHAPRTSLPPFICFLPAWAYPALYVLATLTCAGEFFAAQGEARRSGRLGSTRRRANKVERADIGVVAVSPYLMSSRLPRRRDGSRVLDNSNNNDTCYRLSVFELPETETFSYDSNQRQVNGPSQSAATPRRSVAPCFEPLWLS